MPTEKEIRKQEVPVPFASTPVVREIFGTSKEDVSPLPKSGPRCDRSQRKKVSEVSYFNRFSDKVLHRTRSTYKDSYKEDLLQRG
jgi:hypothetical protein